MDFIQKYNVVIFIETWKVDTGKINIEGYWDYSQIRPKHKNAVSHSGGIAILAKHIIRHGIKLIENTEVFLWFELDKNFFQTDNTTKNILAKIDYFGNFEKAILKYKKRKHINFGGFKCQKWVPR